MNRRRNAMTGLVAIAAVAGGILAVAPAATAQVAGVDQYQPGGGGEGPAGGGGGGNNPESGGGGNNPESGGGGNNPESGSGDDGSPNPIAGEGDSDLPGAAQPGVSAAEAGGGQLPFTGYPMTPLLWIILALITLGVAVRVAGAVSKRRHGTPA